MTDHVRQQLDNAYRFLSQGPQAWTKFERLDPKTNASCILGALERKRDLDYHVHLSYDAFKDVMRFVEGAMTVDEIRRATDQSRHPEKGGRNKLDNGWLLAHFNNHPHTTYEEVVALIDRARTIVHKRGPMALQETVLT